MAGYLQTLTWRSTCNFACFAHENGRVVVVVVHGVNTLVPFISLLRISDLQNIFYVYVYLYIEVCRYFICVRVPRGYSDNRRWKVSIYDTWEKFQALIFIKSWIFIVFFKGFFLYWFEFWSNYFYGICRVFFFFSWKMFF